MKLKNNLFLEIYNEGNNNAKDLLAAANLLYENKFFPQAYALAYTALEEISKSQFAADVYTGLETELRFKKFFCSHHDKIERIKWAHDDSMSFIYRYKWIGPGIDDLQEISTTEPLFNTRQKAFYVDVDFLNNELILPSKSVLEKDALSIIHIVETAFQKIWDISGEFGGMQIGTKGFLK